LNLIITCARSLESETKNEIKKILNELGDQEPKILNVGMRGILMVDTIIDLENIQEIEEKSIKVRGRNLLNLLYNWLEEIVTITITEGFAIKKFSVNIKKNTEYEIVSKVSGEKLDLKKHNFKIEIKSPTFHLMEIKENDEITMQYLLDL